MVAYEGSESTRENFGEFTYHPQPKIKTLVRKVREDSNKII